MPTETLIEEERWRDAGLDVLVDQAFEAVISHFAQSADRFEMSVLGCNDARIAELNDTFRDTAKTTNVLSWPSRDRRADIPGEDPPMLHPVKDRELGDIAIAYECCLREADAAGKPLADHTAHLLVHGTLHLLGYDHENDADAVLMESLEVKILGKMGVPDPY